LGVIDDAGEGVGGLSVDGAAFAPVNPVHLSVPIDAVVAHRRPAEDGEKKQFKISKIDPFFRDRTIWAFLLQTRTRNNGA